MAPEPYPASVPRTPTVTLTVDGQRATLVFSGELNAYMARAMEERFLDPRLLAAREWVLDMSELERMDLACAYALMRAATGTSGPAVIRVRGARRNVQRTLHHAGVDEVATFED
ncbi:STAS domain-containing protein [Streptomyces sp. 8N706]|uniref:STAS domain-containing protein n=1 Tax=Streptomyces sp. 8N706 TaxID=3457416 RepID=UPI003FD46C6F